MKNSAISITIILLLLTGLNVDSKELVDRVVLVVNSDIITLTEYKEFSNELKDASGQDIPKDQIIEQLIDKTLIDQQIKQKGITVTDEELDLTIKNIQTRLQLTDEEMVEALAQQNMTPEQFRENWKKQLTTKKLIDSEIKGSIAITDEEVEQYYRENFGELQSGDEVRVAHILITYDSPDALATANQVAEKAYSGENYSDLAKEYSQDKLTADKGGDLGYFKKGDLVDSLEIAIQNTPKNGVAGPIETASGYHIIKVLDKKTGEGTVPQEYKEEIRKSLYNERIQEFLQAWVDKIQSEAYIEIKI